MANRVKKNGDGDGAKSHPAERQPADKRNLPAPRHEAAHRPAPISEHPLARLRDEMNALFDRYSGGWPVLGKWDKSLVRFWDVDVEDAANEVVVRAEAPGFEPKDFDIHVSGNLLTIQAEHHHAAEQQHEGYRSWERRYGRFLRSIPLPTAVDAGKVDAHYRNGVLELHLPRTEKAQRRRVEVKA
ncbi:MAG TPA: Hsp20/alpha crystallin family protein [Gemmataceae bacterium]|nr:Hsp20/alpha crystallin family protein [Gemmataceae bacterium]